MSYNRIIIDGNNLLHADPEFQDRLRHDFNGARHALVMKLDRIGGSIAKNIIIVFDGFSGRGAEGYENAGIDVRFSDSGFTADATIERLIFKDPRPSEITVVTSDRAERDTIEGAGAHGLSCGMFLDNLRSDSSSMNLKIKRTKRITGLNTLGDHFPDGE